MKKILSILASISLTVPTTLLVVSCGTRIINLSDLETNIGGIDGLADNYIIEGIRKANPGYYFGVGDLSINFDTLHTDDGEPKTGSVEVEGKRIDAGTFTVQFTLNSADLSELERLIAEADDTIQGSKIDQAWFTFNQAIGFAKGVVEVSPLAHKQLAVNGAYYDLNWAMYEFKEANDKKLDLWMLNANIASAKDVVKTDQKDPAAKEVLQNAITAAEAVRDNANGQIWTKEEQEKIAKAADTLWSAVVTFIILPNTNQPTKHLNQEQNNLNFSDRMPTNVLENENQRLSDQLVLEGENMSRATNDLDNVNKTPQQDLEALLAQAKVLEQKDKSFDEYLKLRKAIGHVEGILSVYENETENGSVLSSAIADFKSAMKTFTESPDLKAEKATAKLSDRIKTATDAMGSNHFKPAEIVNNLQGAIITANGVVIANLGISEEKQILEAINELQLAILKFYAADKALADYRELDNTIIEAKNLFENEKDNKIQSIVEKLEREIIKAQEVRGQNLTLDLQDQVNQVVKTLKDTMRWFNDEASNRKEISELIKVTNLGRIEDNKETFIKEAIISKNPGVTDKNFAVDIASITNNKATIKGIGDYKGTIEVTFFIKIRHISTIENELQKVIDSKQDGLWTIQQLEEAFVNANLDIKDGIKIDSKGSLEDQKIGVSKFTITGKAIDGSNNFQYEGEIILYHVLNKEKQDKTIFIDAEKNVFQIRADWAPEGTKEIAHIGWDEMKKAHRAPGTILKVPNYISPEIKSLSEFFKDAAQFNGNISNWDTSNVEIMAYTFQGATLFNGDLSNWNTWNVISMRYMFHNASAFNSDISKWDTRNLLEMESMFADAKSFNHDLKWNVSQVLIMANVFKGASAFNGDISDWDPLNVTTMANMFHSASAFNGDISSWNTKQVTNMNMMFYQAKEFTRDLSDLQVPKVTTHANFALYSGIQNDTRKHPKWVP